MSYTAAVTADPPAPTSTAALSFSVDGAVVEAAPPMSTDTPPTRRAPSAGIHTIVAEYVASAYYQATRRTRSRRSSWLVDAGGPYDIAEGQSITLNGSGSSPGADSYEWDLNGDGIFGDASGPSPELTWKQLEEPFGIDDGLTVPTAYPIALRVTSGSQEQTSVSTIIVTNTAPISVITGGLTATVGVPFTVKVGADDPSSADMAADFTYTVDWGDGSPVQSSSGRSIRR